MKRAWPLVVVALALLACWDFEGEYQKCLDTGRCSQGGGGDGGDGGDGGGGGGDGGDGGGGGFTCPTGAPQGNGLCLLARYDRRAPMFGLYAVSPDLIYFGGYDEAVSTWSNGALQDDVTGLLNGNELADLSGTSQSAIWAGTVGFYSLVYRYDGAQWRDVTPASFSAGDCRGAWSEDAGASWLACDQGLYQVTTANAFQRVSTPAGIAFKGVWGLQGGVAWAVGGDSTAGTANIWQRRSGAWSGLAFTGSGGLSAVHGRSDHDVWAVGASAALMHLDDAGWHGLGSSLSGDLEDVFVGSDGEAWVTAGSNRVMVIAPDGGQRAFVPPGVPAIPGSVLFHQVQVFDTGDVWFTGTTDDGGTELNGLEMHYRKL